MSKAKTAASIKPNKLASDLIAGDRRALAKALTLMESKLGPGAELHTPMQEHVGNGVVVGFTGPPGCGKSTLINAYVSELRRRDKTVAVAAVDPSSPISGGSILGDRLRMTDHGGDDGVFIRSFASGGHLGGLNAHMHRIIDILDAAGWNVIIVETVGTGQSEIDIADLAHVKVVINVPGLGDDIQAIKAGILEIADILVVNKADLPAADLTAMQLDAMLRLRMTSRKDTPVIKTVATRGDGIKELADTIANMGSKLDKKGRADASRARLRRLLIRAAGQMLDDKIALLPEGELDELSKAVLDGKLDFDKATAKLLRKAKL